MDSKKQDDMVACRRGEGGALKFHCVQNQYTAFQIDLKYPLLLLV